MDKRHFWSPNRFGITDGSVMALFCTMFFSVTNGEWDYSNTNVAVGRCNVLTCYSGNSQHLGSEMSPRECGASACGDSRGTRVLVVGVDVSPIMQIFKLVLFCYRSSWWTLVRHSPGKCAIGLRDWWSPMIPFVCHASYMVDQNYCPLPYSVNLWPAVYSWKNWENSEKCLWWQCVIRTAEILPFIISYVDFFLLAFN